MCSAFLRDAHKFTSGWIAQEPLALSHHLFAGTCTQTHKHTPTSEERKKRTTAQNKQTTIRITENTIHAQNASI